MPIKITIDRDGCVQCGNCYNDECPEVFEEDADGTSMVKEKYRKGDPSQGEVPDDLKDCVVAAADSCPVDVITISEE